MAPLLSACDVGHRPALYSDGSSARGHLSGSSAASECFTQAARADVQAFGCLMHTLLAVVPDAPPLPSSREQLSTVDTPTPELAPWVPVKLARLAARCLADALQMSAIATLLRAVEAEVATVVCTDTIGQLRVRCFEFPGVCWAGMRAWFCPFCAWPARGGCSACKLPA